MAEFKVGFHDRQAEMYNAVARFKVCAAGRRFGKSHYAAYECSINALQTVNARGFKLTKEHPVYYIAPTADQAKRIMWPKLQEILGYKKHGGFITRENSNEGWIEVEGGCRIYCRGADNPETLRGVAYRYVVLDEYADMKSMVWTQIVRPSLADVQGGALFIGTPKGKNHFFKLLMNATGWEKMPDQKPDDYDPQAWKDWKGFFFKSLDNPLMTMDEVRAMEGDMGREEARQELEASFISGGGNVLKPHWFRIVNPANGYTSPQQYGRAPDGRTVITVDLAGFAKGDNKKIQRLDESVICVTRIEEDNWVVLDMQHGRWDPNECAMRIVKAAIDFPNSRLGVEKGILLNAIGLYLESYMREFRKWITVEPLTHGNTRKIDRIVWALQARAQRGKIQLLKGEWNQWFLDQVSDFPDRLSHDDGIDALAYAEQMAQVSYLKASDLEINEWEVLDPDSGY